MAELQDQKFQEIAAWIAAREESDGWWKNQDLGSTMPYSFYKEAFSDIGLDVELLMTDLKPVWQEHNFHHDEGYILRGDVGSLSDASSITTDLFHIKVMLQRGKATNAEAAAYMREKYSGIYEFGGGLFKGTYSQTAEKLAVDSDQPKEGEEGFKKLGDRAHEISQALISDGASAGASLHVPVNPGRVPAEYNADGMQSVLDDLGTELSLRMGEIRGGNIAFRANSIPGAALRPGSVRLPKLNPVDMRGLVEGWPGPDQAIELDLSHDTTMDRWWPAGDLAFSSGETREVRGPGRVWKVTGYPRLPKGFRPGPGPVRYRLVIPGMRFGIFSIETRLGVGGNSDYDTHAAIYDITYGMVVRGIPNLLGRNPQFIDCGPEGDPPAGLGMQLVGSSGGVQEGTKELFQERTDNLFVATTPDQLETYSLLTGTPQHIPSSNEMRRARGWRFDVLRGETWQQVFAELCTRKGFYADVGGQPTALTASTAPLTDSQPSVWGPPCPPTCVMRDEDLPGVLRWVQKGNLPASGDSSDVIQGVPFIHEDCERLVSTSGPGGSFACVIRPMMSGVVFGDDMKDRINSPSLEMRPGAWWTAGVRSTEGGHRQLAVDIVVW